MLQKSKYKLRPFGSCKELVDCASSRVTLPEYCVNPILQKIPSLAIKPPLIEMKAEPARIVSPPKKFVRI